MGGQQRWERSAPRSPKYRVMPKSKPLPPVEALLEWFSFDPETGRFYWKKKPARQIRIGVEAGWCQLHGQNHPRWSIIVPGYGRYLRSRLVWKLSTGVDPDTHLDHKDGNSINDVHSNLVNGGVSWNNRNRKCRAKSGLPGAYPASHTSNKWISTIQVAGKTVYLGLWDTPEEASTAYLKARLEFEQAALAG